MADITPTIGIGFHEVVGADFSASANKLGTRALLPDSDIALNGLVKKHLVHWWDFTDRGVVGGKTQLYDRLNPVSAAKFQTNSGTAEPVDATANGYVGLDMSGSGTTWPVFDAAASQGMATPAFTYLFLIEPSSIATAAYILTHGAAAPNGFRIRLETTGQISAYAADTGAVTSTLAVAAAELALIGVSWDGAKFGFSKNGVFEGYKTPGVIGTLTASTVFRISGDRSGTGRLNAALFHLMGFSADLHTSANAVEFLTACDVIKQRYGIA